MNQLQRFTIAVGLLAAVPAMALPQHSHSSAPSHSGRGFSMPHDVNARSVSQHGTPQRAYAAPQRPTAVRAPYQSGPYRGWRGPVIRNPRGWGGWGWNRGVPWYPAPIYWGGGFWGPWALGVSTGLVLFGSVLDEGNQLAYPSYQIEGGSPGAQLLADYGLQQTDCGPPNLVVIWGPDNGVVCAYPSTLVAPGTYEVDPTTLTLQSLNAPP
jgi:hypothetical protein